MNILGMKAYGFDPIQPIKPGVTSGIEGGQPKEGQKTKSFGEIFTDAVQEVDNSQKTADNKIEQWVTGKGDVNTHEAMIALEKADVSFQLMNAVRGKIVRAYEEIMRTQV